MKHNMITTSFALSILGCLIIFGCATSSTNARAFEGKRLEPLKNEHYGKDVDYVAERQLKEAENVNLKAFFQETQKQSLKTGDAIMVWWLPEEHWKMTFGQQPNMTSAQVDQLLELLRPYTLIVAVCGKVGIFGGITYESETTIRNDIHLVDNQGVNYRPLSEEEIDADTKNFLSMIKPTLANMLGPLGQNMHFVAFSAKGKMGQNIAEAKKKGFFSIKLGKNSFKWRLPLASLLAPKTCPVCEEKMSGAWQYCPWDGAKLN